MTARRGARRAAFALLAALLVPAIAPPSASSHPPYREYDEGSFLLGTGLPYPALLHGANYWTEWAPSLAIGFNLTDLSTPPARLLWDYLTACGYPCATRVGVAAEAGSVNVRFRIDWVYSGDAQVRFGVEPTYSQCAVPFCLTTLP